eukprot:TRINITY_DN10180_c0_g3_i1.p1 TRINITY_DN10180_c0_g3~~TRINITY_DN10180_c0_g3_i1.p1  ORF type:complete len:405 (+),score=62.44 TRINITY_DN10180_c0_g3_i1:2-1216(+)
MADRARTSTLDLAGEQRVLIQELNKGQPCLDCDDCPGFELHVWKKACKHCNCPTRRHKQADGPAKPEVGQLEFVEEVPDDFDPTGYNYDYTGPEDLERPTTPPRPHRASKPVLVPDNNDDEDEYEDLTTAMSIAKMAASKPPITPDTQPSAPLPTTQSGDLPPPRPPKTKPNPAPTTATHSATLTMSGGPERPPKTGPKKVVATPIESVTSASTGGAQRPTSYDPHSIPAAEPPELKPARNAAKIVHNSGSEGGGKGPPPVGRSFSGASEATAHGMPAELEELYGDGSQLFTGYSYEDEYAYWEIVHSIDRLTAEAVLTSYASTTGDIRGLYLVRHSSKVAGAVVVSMYDKSRLFHYQFLPTPFGTFVDDKGKDRGSLSQLVTHYESHREGMARELGTCLGPAA